MKFLLLTLIFLSTSCSIVRGSYHYSKGTQFLQEGDYPEAIEELEQAVALDPEFARYHTNLYMAYLGNKQYDKAWPHCRQAVLCKYQDGCSEKNFYIFFNLIMEVYQLDNPEATYENFTRNLGLPDVVTFTSIPGEVATCTYGICKIEFKDNKFVKRSFLR